MVVEDIESIAPRNSELMLEKPMSFPTKEPRAIISATIITAVIAAEPPTLSSFLKLNSSPSENRSTIIPI